MYLVSNILSVDARQEKGLILAKGARQITGGTWTVPSQSNETAAYLVDADTAACTGADLDLRAARCDQLVAVELLRDGEKKAVGTQVVTESVKVTRKTYT